MPIYHSTTKNPSDGGFASEWDAAHVCGGGVASIPFTDGDTMRRVTITDANVNAGSRIVASVTRPDTADDSQDPGYIYIANVVRIGTGSFDVLISCLDWGFDDPVENPPNETVTLHYIIL
jgi:hypothetical protein